MPTAGFDLDMTLIDPRRGVADALEALSADTGVFVDAGVVCSRLGPKLEDELAHWFAADQIAGAAATYRHHYAATCVDGTDAMPGARELVEAMRESRGPVVVVTAKPTDLAVRCLAALAIEVDAVAGWLHGLEKAALLQRFGADIYVGDTAADMAAGKAASAFTVGVTTGPDHADTLRTAGADLVVSTLTDAHTSLAALARW
jgi:phosphoglycolate phosphatase